MVKAKSDRPGRLPAFDTPARTYPEAPVRRPVLIVGGSHTLAVRNGLSREQRPHIAIINLRQPKFASLFDEEVPTPALARAFQPKGVISMIGGNTHHAYGLFEHPEPYDFVAPENSALAEGRRTIIPYAAMLAMMRVSLARHCTAISALKSLFSCPVYQILAPPPICDVRFLLEEPGTFGERAQYGLAPVSLRLKLFNLQNRVFRSHCEELGMPVIEPPAEALDAEGCLLPQFADPDGTHANSDYGHLLVPRILETNHGA